MFFLTLTSPGVLLGGGLLVPNKLLPLVVSGPSEGRRSLEIKEDYFIVKDTPVSQTKTLSEHTQSMNT